MSFEIISQTQTSVLSKVFRVDPGKAVVISSFNFSGPMSDEVGNTTKPGDCAVLHKIEIQGAEIPMGDGCGCVLDGLESSIKSNEPVVVCGQTWTHNCENNLTVLSVPGVYMFELCSPESIGSVTMQVEEISLEQAAVLPQNLFHGAC